MAASVAARVPSAVTARAPVAAEPSTRILLQPLDAQNKSPLFLQPLDSQSKSPLFLRRSQNHHAASVLTGDQSRAVPAGILTTGRSPLADGKMSLSASVCSRCGEGFSATEKIVNSNGEIWHTHCFVLPKCAHCAEDIDSYRDKMVNYKGQVWHLRCFVCAQCFQPFPDSVFYEFEGRKYCEHDFHILFAPNCGKCGEFVIGRVIKAMNSSWHPDCFLCQLCNAPLADSGFVKNAGRALCRECNAKEKASGSGKFVCHKCHSIIDEGHIQYRGNVYHPYHFSCSSCGCELGAGARERSVPGGAGSELVCLRCHDKTEGVAICGACRRPVEGRVVHALGKAWHVEHFVCAKCEKPFHGSRHYERRGLAYCETHYHQLFGDLCFACNNVISGDVFRALNKCWCVDHFACSLCDRKMAQKAKFFELDLKPVCKVCFEKLPSELKKRLKKAYDRAVAAAAANGVNSMVITSPK